MRRFTEAHEQAGFDRILIGYFTNATDVFIVAPGSHFFLDTVRLAIHSSMSLFLNRTSEPIL
jgi:hypothetical protein